jgi:hypothetical protein
VPLGVGDAGNNVQIIQNIHKGKRDASCWRGLTSLRSSCLGALWELKRQREHSQMRVYYLQ